MLKNNGVEIELGTHSKKNITKLMAASSHNSIEIGFSINPNSTPQRAKREVKRDALQDAAPDTPRFWNAIKKVPKWSQHRYQSAAKINAKLNHNIGFC